MFNINAASKTLKFRLIFSKKNFNFIYILKKLNLFTQIRLVKYCTRAYFQIFIHYYKNIRIGSNFNLISKPSRSVFISLQALKLLCKRACSSIFLISTTCGIVTHHEAIKKKQGGYIVGHFLI